MSAAEDIAQYLADEGLGAYGGTAAFALYVGEEPPEPNQVVTVYDTGGTMGNPDERMYDPNIQIRVRSVDYLAGYAHAEEIRDKLLLPTGRVIGEWFYTGFWLTADIAKFGKDHKDRNLFSVNFRLMREPYLTE